MCAPCERVRKGSEEVTLARIIHEFRRGEFETEGHRGFSLVRPREAYLQTVEKAEQEKPGPRKNPTPSQVFMNRPDKCVIVGRTVSASFPPGCGFGGPNPLRPRLGSFERGQLPSGSILLVLQLVELRLEMELLPLVQRGAFFLRKLDPISTSPSPLDPLFQRLPQLLGTHA